MYRSKEKHKSQTNEFAKVTESTTIIIYMYNNKEVFITDDLTKLMECNLGRPIPSVNVLSDCV